MNIEAIFEIPKDSYHEIMKMMQKTRTIGSWYDLKTITKIFKIYNNLIFDLFIIERKCYRLRCNNVLDDSMLYTKTISPEIEYLLEIKDINVIKKILFFYGNEMPELTHIPLKEYPNNHLVPQEFDIIYKPSKTLISTVKNL